MHFTFLLEHPNLLQQFNPLPLLILPPINHPPVNLSDSLIEHLDLPLFLHQLLFEIHRLLAALPDIPVDRCILGIQVILELFVHEEELVVFGVEVSDLLD